MQLFGTIRQWWGTLTGDSWATAVGERTRLAGRILEQRGIAKRQSDRELEEFVRRNRNWCDLSRR
jgi:uncharacterized protein YjbJ (UPF0337 family)